MLHQHLPTVKHQINVRDRRTAQQYYVTITIFCDEDFLLGFLSGQAKG